MLIEIPELYASQTREMNAVRRRFRSCSGRRYLLRSLRNHPVAVEQLDLNCQRTFGWFQMLNETINVNTRSGTQHVLWLHENILNKRSRNNAQRHFAVDPAEGEIVDL